MSETEKWVRSLFSATIYGRLSPYYFCSSQYQNLTHFQYSPIVEICLHTNTMPTLRGCRSQVWNGGGRDCRKEREREKDREKETGKEGDRETDGQTERGRERQTDKQTHTQSKRKEFRIRLNV